MNELIGCPHCGRHVRTGERACPFCGSALDGAAHGVVNGVSRRELTRGAIVMGAAALLSACGGSDEPLDEGGGEGTSGGDEGDSFAADAGTDAGGATAGGDPSAADAGPDSGGATAGGDEELVDPIEDRYRRRCDPGDMACMAMPYGAPALPDAIV
jgi:hypothetical protein